MTITHTEEFLDELDECVDEADTDILIGGDFNSKSTLWDCSSTNARGDRLAHWSASRDLMVLNVGIRPTCVRH